MSRARREGTLGLSILGGMGLLLLVTSTWRTAAPPQTYAIRADFITAPGIDRGTAVRYEGKQVGAVADIKLSTTGVQAVLAISDFSSAIPNNAVAEIRQVGFSAPVIELTASGTAAGSVDRQCTAQVANCNRLSGRDGASFVKSLQRTIDLFERYQSPQLYTGLKETLDGASRATADVSRLSQQFGALPQEIRAELRSLSQSAASLSQSIALTAQNAGGAISQVGNTADSLAQGTAQFNAAADRLGQEADRATITSNEYGQLARSLDRLVGQNRRSLQTTLAEFNALSTGLRRTVNTLRPAIAQLETQLDPQQQEQLIGNLEKTMAQAEATTANLRDFSNSLNNNAALGSLQQTIAATRISLASAEKLIAEWGPLLANPEFRRRIKTLVQDLGQFSSTGATLEEQIRLEKSLIPAQRQLPAITPNADR